MKSSKYLSALTFAAVDGEQASYCRRAVIVTSVSNVPKSGNVPTSLAPASHEMRTPVAPLRLSGTALNDKVTTIDNRGT